MASIATVTIELCAEDRARLDTLIEKLSTRPDCERCAQGITHYVAATVAAGVGPTTSPTAPASTSPTAAPTSAQKNAEETAAPAAPAASLADLHPVEEPTPFDEPAVPTVSRSDIQGKVVQLSAAGKKPQVREIVQKYAPKISDIPEDKLGAVWAELTALEG